MSSGLPNTKPWLFGNVSLVPVILSLLCALLLILDDLICCLNPTGREGFGKFGAFLAWVGIIAMTVGGNMIRDRV